MSNKKKKKKLAAINKNAITKQSQIKDLEQRALNFINQQNYDAAYALYLKIAGLGHSSTTTLANLGAVALMKANWDESIKYLEKAIITDPNILDAWINLGVAFQSKSQLQDALVCFSKSLEIDPHNAIVHNNVGITYKRLNNTSAAIYHYKKATELNPNYYEAFNNLGLLYKEIGDAKAAIECFQQALRINQQYCDALSNLADAYNLIEEYENAINSYKQLLKIDSANIKAHLKLADNFKKGRQYQSALIHLKLARKYAPENIDVLNDLGVIQMDMDNISESISIFETALTLNPNHSGILSNIAMAFEHLGELTKANNLYRKALYINPHQAEANHNLGLLLLLTGRYQEGWQYYEWRFAGKEQKLLFMPSCEPLKMFDLNPKLNLLVVAEQGLGDTLQFMRYIPLIAKQVNNLYFCAQPPLEGIIRSSGISDNLLTLNQAMAIKDAYWLPLLNIPNHLNIEPKNVIISEPYIHTTKSLMEKWHAKFFNEKLPVIAINWQGNPNAEQSNNKGRSIPLKTFEPLASIPNIKLLSLQKGYGSEQLDDCLFKDKFVSFQQEISNTWDFCETSAIIKSCNLVITSDTSIAHLAAALGHPTWLLIKKIPDWRWGLNSDSSFWYPSMRIFRQDQQGDWHALMQRVKEELLKFISLIS